MISNPFIWVFRCLLNLLKKIIFILHVLSSFNRDSSISSASELPSRRLFQISLIVDFLVPFSPSSFLTWISNISQSFFKTFGWLISLFKSTWTEARSPLPIFEGQEVRYPSRSHRANSSSSSLKIYKLTLRCLLRMRWFSTFSRWRSRVF